MKKIILMFVSLFFTVSVQAANYYSSAESCEAIYYENNAVAYQPTGKHKHYGNSRVVGYEKRPLEGDACVYLGAKPGKRWVFMSRGTMVYTKGVDVTFLFECQNDIYKVVYLTQKEQVLAPKVSILVPTPLVAPAITIITPPPLVVAAENKTSKCSDCKPHEEVKENRKEARADGRCFVQTNMGYKFELRSEHSTGRIMIGLVSPETNTLLEGTKAHYIGNERSTITNMGPDCSADQSKLYKQENWNSVRESFGIPSICKLKKEV